MQKDELISLANKMCKELLTIIDEEETATKEQVANYLRESAQIIIDVDEENLNNDGLAASLFHNAYKDIAKKSLSSYATTNENIQKIAQMHEEELSEYDPKHIDLSTVTGKFAEMQALIGNEIKKANEVITQLTSQVKTLEEKSNLDSLTKVFNRRALSSYLENVCSHEKLKYEFHMLLLDIDDFKNINDTYGHVAGDKVLIFISNILRKALRDGDKIFRYGGEEFIIVLNRTDDEHCKKITSRLLELVRANKLLYKGETLRVTMSVGVTKFSQGDTPDSIIDRTDKALYKAKGNGKNQMYVEMI